MRSRCIVLAVSFIVLLAPFAISAGDSPFDKSEWEEVNIKLGVGYRYFIDEGMSEAYTGCGELTFRFSARGMKILSLEQQEIKKPFKSGLRGEYHEVPKHDLETRHCGRCGSELKIVKDAKRVLCESCGHVIEVGVSELACPGCSTPVSLPVNATQIQCPSCGGVISST